MRVTSRALSLLTLVASSLLATTARADPPVTPQDNGDTSAADTRRAGKTVTFAGLGIFGTGYLGAVVAAGIGTAIKGSEEGKYGGSCATSAPLSFIPVVGPLLTSSQYPQHQIATYGQGSPHVLDCNSGRTPVIVLSVIGEVLQIGGLATALTGLVLLGVASAKTPAGTVSLVPAAPGASMGMTLSLDTM